MTVTLRSVALGIYSIFTLVLLHNLVRYLLIKKMYREISIVIFYFFSFPLICARFTEILIAFDEYLIDNRIISAIAVADGATVCIVLSQVCLVADLTITLQLFKE